MAKAETYRYAIKATVSVRGNKKSRARILDRRVEGKDDFVEHGKDDVSNNRYAYLLDDPPEWFAEGALVPVPLT